MENVNVMRIRNMYGVAVKRWCGSCQHRCIHKEGFRYCAVMQIKVNQNFVCNQWEMSDGMKNAGLGGGVVHLRGREEETINNDH